MINPQVYKVMIDSGGERVVWYKAFAAPSYAPAIGLDESVYDTHYDQGKVYVRQGERQALVQEQQIRMWTPESGVVFGSRLMLTAMPDEMDIRPYDKVVLLERETPVREQLIRGPYAGSRAIVDKVGMLLPVRLVAVTNGTTEYRLGHDVTLNSATRAITWVSGGSSPSAGDPYMIEYTCHKAYIFQGEGHREARPVAGTEQLLPIKGELVESTAMAV